MKQILKTFLKPLVATEKYKNILAIGEFKNEEIELLEECAAIYDGKLIIASNTTKNEYDLFMDTDKNISSIMVKLQREKIHLDIIIMEDELEQCEELFKRLNDKGLIIANKNIDVTESKKIGIIRTRNYNYLYHNSYINNNCFEEIKNRISKIEDKLGEKQKIETPTIGVGVLTYNHEHYIEECLRNIFSQKGNFKMKLYIINDCSTDETAIKIESFLKQNKNKNIETIFINNEQNKGMIANFKYCLEQFKNTDYFTFCEGDDYWISDYRIQKFIDFFNNDTSISIAFNSMYIYDNDYNYVESYVHKYLQNKYSNSKKLINYHNFIGNFSCCFYDSKCLKYLKDEYFSTTIYDFLFNLLYSTYGYIGHLDECLSVYRYHNNSLWSSKKEIEKNLELQQLLNDYDKLTNFAYDPEFSKYKNILNSSEVIPNKSINKDLLIIDNAFPCEFSKFSYQEISSYLKYFNNSLCLSTGAFLPCFNDENITADTEIQKWRIKHPNIASRVEKYEEMCLFKYKPKLLYFIFYKTVEMFWNYIENSEVPFVFELYPGGGFFFDNETSDRVLRKVMSSKYFKKVIVTQKIVEEYLLKKKMCKKEQIELVFGVVMPEENVNKTYNIKKNYKFEKENLDILFMAHKYTEFGQDKGYDKFIEVAHKLCKKYDNINFHVVGNFDENTIDVKEIKDRIKFYGIINSTDFDNFFQDKDIIVSANLPNLIQKGAFDGFPTASVCEAGLRKTAMFCTDPLGMNNNYFEPKKDIEIIEADSNKIVKLIEFYYKNPEELKNLGICGYNKIKKLYSYDVQMNSRIKILDDILKGEN